MSVMIYSSALARWYTVATWFSLPCKTSLWTSFLGVDACSRHILVMIPILSYAIAPPIAMLVSNYLFVSSQKPWRFTEQTKPIDRPDNIWYAIWVGVCHFDRGIRILNLIASATVAAFAPWNIIFKTFRGFSSSSKYAWRCWIGRGSLLHWPRLVTFNPMWLKWWYMAHTMILCFCKGNISFPPASSLFLFLFFIIFQ